MPYVVTMKYMHPTDEIKVYSPSDEFKALRTIHYRNTGKIVAQDYVVNREQKTETVTIVFRDKQAFDEWNAEPLVQDFFQKRDDFLRSNFIYKTSTSQEV